jgi:hypothetical protein
LKTNKVRPFNVISNRIGIIFLVAGIFSIGFSVFANSEILALIGLGLTFWGALFFFITPNRYVERVLLESTAFSAYATIDRMMTDLKVSGKGYYIPPYPKDVFLPEHLKGLKDAIVFIPKEDTSEMPAIEEIAESKFEGNKTQGIFIIAPGAALLEQIEKKSKLDLSKFSKAELYESLPNLIINNFSLANEVILRQKDEEIQLILRDSAFQNLYSRELGLKSISLLGCAIASAIACALSKSAGKRIVLKAMKGSIDTHLLILNFLLMEG